MRAAERTKMIERFVRLDALGSLLTYLEAAPDAPDRATIERHVGALRQLIASLN